MFKPVSSKLNIPHMEEDILNFWRLYRVFARCVEHRKGEPEYVFYEGPPTANGRPCVHHIPARAFKDVFLRYKFMRGYQVKRRGGWDTHGLPVEIEVERQLGFSTKKQIEDFGIAKFNDLCRTSAFEYIKEWERFSDRIAYWVDLDDAYVTFTNQYIESVWWILKTYWDKGLLYQGYRVVPYCPRCGTPLSTHEVAQGYKLTEDPSIFVRMPLVDEPGTSLLVWTTTPWTLPANVAVAAHPEIEYAVVQRSMPEGGRERLILANDLVTSVFGDEPVRIVETIKGRKLRGRPYQPLFNFVHPDKQANHVVLQDYVSIEDGTGLVHLAPAFGADDLHAALELDLPVILTVDDAGRFIPEVRKWSGVFVKQADPLIIQELQARGLVYKAEKYEHTYPFCWRCDTPLLYTARGTWYIRTRDFKERLVSLNKEINWIPGHLKEGRFGNWLENNVDWALGRERYWGTPLPIWECVACHHQLAVGSISELHKLADCDLSNLDLHRPHIDEIRIPCPECGEDMKRVPEVIDVWFDSGSMPVAQWHFPYNNRTDFRRNYPADFICEGVDQTRGWFYALHAISALLFNQVAFRNVISIGLFLDEDGQKMSKTRGNVLDPWEMFVEYGSDAFRWYLFTTGSPGSERRFSMDRVKEAVRGFTLPLWNVYTFFVTYANLDGWQPANILPTDDPVTSDLDRWLRSELHSVIGETTAALERYDVPGAVQPLRNFVDDLSKWYLRRSRRRFWSDSTDAVDITEKQAAYATLYEALVTLCKLLAPLMPFLAEVLYQNLVRTADDEALLSVHMTDWPKLDHDVIDLELNARMRKVMKLASLGHSARATAGIKVRQPLAGASFWLGKPEETQTINTLAHLLAEELNVKTITALDSVSEAVSYRLKPLPKQLGSKYQNRFPEVREAIEALEPVKTAKYLLAGQDVQVVSGGDTLSITPDEVEVHLEAQSGLEIASEGVLLVAIDTVLTPELKAEGLAREFVRHVQELRKQADLEIADHLQLYVHATPDLLAALSNHKDYVMRETLTDEWLENKPPQEASISEAWFNGEWMKIWLLKADVSG